MLSHCTSHAAHGACQHNKLPAEVLGARREQRATHAMQLLLYMMHAAKQLLHNPPMLSMNVA
jgi:hypothetical protein